VIGGIFGAVVELDNDDTASASTKRKKNEKLRASPRTRVATSDLDDDLASPSEKSSARRKRA
jgi:hypothetical protein